MQISKIGLDLAKNVFHIVCCDPRGRVAHKKQLKRKQVLAYFTRLAPCTVGMEACASAHYWHRQLTAMGHEVKLIPAQHVKPFVQGNKNDYNDALAIAEALDRPNIRFVAAKTPQQQDIQSLHRLRTRCISSRTGLSNQIRGLLAEYGIIIPRGISQVRRQIPAILEDAENGLSDLFRQLLAQSYEQFTDLDKRIEFYTQQVNRLAQADKACRQLQTIPGYGPILASVFHSMIGEGKGYRRGRDVSASLGIVPRQHSTGGKDQLLGISKRGNAYLRSLLIHGARSVLSRAANKEDPLSLWMNRIRMQRGFNKAAVALANKMARLGWAILSKKTSYQPQVS